MMSQIHADTSQCRARHMVKESANKQNELRVCFSVLKLWQTLQDSGVFCFDWFISGYHTAFPFELKTRYTLMFRAKA